ncbi:unnamed protein product, partial [Candidula unifasciata]
MSHSAPTPRSQDATKAQAGTPSSPERASFDPPLGSEESLGEQQKDPEDFLGDEQISNENKKEASEGAEDTNSEESDAEDVSTSHILITGDDETYPEDTQRDNASGRPRPKLTTSNSRAEIMLGLETDDGKSAEVEIDSLETDELQPE